MSVYIPGMEMPKNCSDCLACHILSDEGLYCEPLDTDIELGSFGRLANCPLVPVPPHGDLIDRDEIKFDWDEDDKTWGYDIHSAPTIIPAEEEQT